MIGRLETGICLPELLRSTEYRWLVSLLGGHLDEVLAADADAKSAYIDGRLDDACSGFEQALKAMSSAEQVFLQCRESKKESGTQSRSRTAPQSGEEIEGEDILGKC